MNWVRHVTDAWVDKKLYPTLFGDSALRAAEPVPTGHREVSKGEAHTRCLHVTPKTKAPRQTAVYFHGNAVTLGDLARTGWLQSLADALQYDILCPDYASPQSAQGRNLDTCQVLHAQNVLSAVAQESGKNSIAVIGRSLGCAIALRAVAETSMEVSQKINHVHLVSPFASLDALLPAWALRWGLLTANRFNSIDAVQRLAGNIHMSVYHGTADAVIPLHNATNLSTARETAKWPSTKNTLDAIDGMTHDPLPSVKKLISCMQNRVGQ